MTTTAISNDTQVPSKGASSSNSPSSDLSFPTNLASLLIPPLPQRSPGPEPPPLASDSSTGAGGAAKTPNANSPKLDSSRNGKTKALSSTDDLTAAMTVAQASALQTSQAQTAPTVKPTADSVTAVSTISAAPAEKAAAETKETATQLETPKTESEGQAKAQPLPQDSIAPIVSVTAASSPVSPTVLPPITLSDVKTAVAKPAAISSTEPVTPAAKTVSTPAKPSAAGSKINETISVADKGSAGNASSSFGQQSGMGHNGNQASSQGLTTEKAAAVSNAQTVDRKALIAQVANHFDNVAAANPKGGVTVQLAPQAMGTITVTLKTVGKQIDAQVSASNPDVKTALEQSRPELSQAMESRGYSLAGMTFTSDSGSFNSQMADQGRSQSSSANASPAPVRTAAIADSPSISQASYATSAPAGVDLWI